MLFMQPWGQLTTLHSALFYLINYIDRPETLNPKTQAFVKKARLIFVFITEIRQVTNPCRVKEIITKCWV